MTRTMVRATSSVRRRYARPSRGLTTAAANRPPMWPPYNPGCEGMESNSVGGQLVLDQSCGMGISQWIGRGLAWSSQKSRQADGQGAAVSTAAGQRPVEANITIAGRAR